MKKFIFRNVSKIKNIQSQKSNYKKFADLYVKYSGFTMIRKEEYIDNLLIAQNAKHLKGDIVECGVWRGGMIAGIAESIGKGRKCFLFDSFEGLPEAKEIDGQSAIDWQKNVHGDSYYENCKAEIEYAENAMKLAGADFKCIKGWFNETISVFNSSKEISLLRLDGDWYESTMICLKYLYPLVVQGGIIIIDDYHVWDGCSRAVHDYLSETKSISRISTSGNGICFILKADK